MPFFLGGGGGGGEGGFMFFFLSWILLLNFGILCLSTSLAQSVSEICSLKYLKLCIYFNFLYICTLANAPGIAWDIMLCPDSEVWLGGRQPMSLPES